MEKLVEELSKLLPLKDSTAPGDIVLIAAEEPQMLLYARVEKIERDSSRKDEWWHVSMAMLSIPLQRVTWTLRTEQMTGQEIFTMGGEKRFVKAVEFGKDVEKDGGQAEKFEKPKVGLKRVK